MFQKKGEEMVKSLQMKYQDFQKKQASGELAPIEADKQAALLKEEEAKIGEFEQSSQQKIYEKSEELLKPIQDKVNQAIKDVAKENGFLYIFDVAGGLLLYTDPSADATKLVKTYRPAAFGSAHIVLGVTEQEHGTAARALAAMDVDRARLRDAAIAELRA